MGLSGRIDFRPLKITLFIITVLAGIFFISLIIPPVKELGIHPRSIGGLLGIITSPFIHLDWAHFTANAMGIFILGMAFFTLEKDRALYILVPVFLIAGFGTWLIGRSGSNHIGASGIIYGLLGYLLTIGIFTKKMSAILVSIIVFVLYGGAIWGIFPQFGHSIVSWEGHLSGFIAGIIVAKFESKRKIKSP